LKLSSPKAALTQRDWLLRERAQASALRSAFPHVGQLRIELTFSDARAIAPSPQVHTLYPPAPAFFRFACPCADCDGAFDLTAAVTSLLDGQASRQRAVRGQVACGGARFRGTRNSVCSVQLDYRMVSSPSGAP
jgi:hypothetical protein